MIETAGFVNASADRAAAFTDRLATIDPRYQAFERIREEFVNSPVLLWSHQNSGG
jgi:hypothetical protein